MVFVACCKRVLRRVLSGGFLGLSLVFVGLSVRAEEAERLGRFEISEFALSPRLRLQEPGQGGFELSQSWIAFEWTRDELVRGVLKLGSSDLTRPVIWMSPKDRPDFGVAEAWMEGRSLYGDLRAGLLSVPQSFEGVAPEWDSVLPETRARRLGWFIKRDYGLQFRWVMPEWETSISVHNGESDTNHDGKYWATSHWQFKDHDGTGVLITGSFGQTRSGSTATAVAGQVPNSFVFDPNQEARIRQASLAFFHEEKRHLLLLEAGRGEVFQSEDKNSFFWGHFDAVWNWGGDFSLLFRFEQDQPDQKDAETVVRSTGAGFSVSSRDNLQSLTLFASHQEEKPEIPSDELWLIFRIQSLLSR